MTQNAELEHLQCIADKLEWSQWTVDKCYFVMLDFLTLEQSYAKYIICIYRIRSIFGKQ